MDMATQFIILFGTMFIGLLAFKIGLLNNKSLDGFCKFTVYIGFPALLVYRTSLIELTDEVLHSFFMMILLGGLVLVVTILVAHFYYRFRKLTQGEKNVLEFCSYTGNNGFIGIPMALAFWGEQGLFYMIATNVFICFAIWVYGILVLQRGGNQRTTFKQMAKATLKCFINPNIIATVVGLIISLLHLTLPAGLTGLLSGIGDTASPMAMIFLGASLTGEKVTNLLKDKLVIDCTIMRLFVSPLLTLALVWFLPIDSLMKSILVFMMILPVGATMPMIVSTMDGDAVFTSKNVLMTTILSIGTIPLWMLVINTL
ncbi:MAG: AEC family transporter [Clostridiales Family XIII bacterium]|jgi:predicted permease|nr:AEC family transporter [Clostridiales Family XIII bacterium]